MKSKSFLIVAMAFSAFSGVSLAQLPVPAPPVDPAAEPSSPAPAPGGKADLIAIASHAEDFSTFVAAVEAAGLTETLKGDGPFTVFAPPNSAFEALPDGTMTELMKPENKDKLAAILSYHVWPAKKMLIDLASEEVTTVQGKKVAVKVDRQLVTINGAKITKSDVNASNGVIHVIEKVLIPPAD
jgi:uncharacterized surface protein with fasciclin (FAS1) repeats